MVRNLVTYHHYFDARSEVLTAVLIKLKVVCVVTQSHVEVAGISEDYSAFFFKVSLNMCQSTWQNNPEDLILLFSSFSLIFMEPG
jgi:hypothetical protein